MSDTATRPRIAYLTGLYPLVSLTFIQREVAALRAQGYLVETVSVRKTPRDQHRGQEGRDAAASTYYLLEAAKSPATVLRAQIKALRRPKRYFAAMRLAWCLRGPGLKSLAYQMIYFLEATLMADYVRRRNIGHIHSHFVTNGTSVAMLTSELTGVPFSFMLHGPADLFEPYRWRLDLKTRRAAFVTTISHYARSQLMYFSSADHWHKIRIVHCGVTPALYSGALPRPTSDTVRLIFVGRLDPVKGVRVLFDALDDLFTRLPGLRLTMVGDGPDRKSLEAAAARFGDRVRFTGYLTQQEVADALADHDICVLPSFAEGVPVILMEAMASARPVVATQVAGVGELVEHGVSGLIARPGDVDSLKAHIETLAGDADLRARMGAAGRDKVQAQFDIDREAAWLGALIDGRAGHELRPKCDDLKDNNTI